MKKPIKSDNAPQAICPYNQAIMVTQFVFVSGQIPFDKESKLISDDIKKQTLQCLTNIESILKEAGLDRNSIVKITIFLKEMNDFPLVNEEYANFFEGTVYPARATVEVARLPKDVKIEIEAIAYKE